MKHTRRSGFPKAACSEVHSTWNHVFFFLYFLEFPLLVQSSHTLWSFAGQTSSHLLSTWLGLDADGFLDEIRCCHALWMEKSKRKKAPGTGFSRPLRIPLLQSRFWKSFCRFLKQFLAYYSVSVWRAVIGWSRGWCNCSSSWAACGYRFADVRQQVWVTGQLLDIYPILLSVGQTTPDKCLQIPPKAKQELVDWQEQEAFFDRSNSVGAGPIWQPSAEIPSPVTADSPAAVPEAHLLAGESTGRETCCTPFNPEADNNNDAKPWITLQEAGVEHKLLGSLGKPRERNHWCWLLNGNAIWLNTADDSPLLLVWLLALEGTAPR